MSYDYLIVGAGTAGCILANRLTENPDVKVLLLEAGAPDRDAMIHIPAGVGQIGRRNKWHFMTVPQPQLDNRQIWYPQGKTFGGSSSINAMIYIRGQKEDYDEWADLGNKGWSYDDVLPYFIKSEDNSRLTDDYHGQGGPQAVSDQTNPHILSTSFVRAAQSWGLPPNTDFNGPTAAGAGLYQVTCRAGLRKSQSTAFLRPAVHRKNLTVKAGARVVRIVVQNGKAVGIELAARRGKDTQILRANREIIIASGAINTPRLMMLSGIGSATELSSLGIKPAHDLPAVGKNLMDHLNTNLHSLLKEPISYDALVRFPRPLAASLQWLFFRTGPAASNITEGGGFFTSPGETRPDMQIHLAPATVIRGGHAPVPGNGFTVGSSFLRPQSVGSVRLASANPADEPLIDPRYLSEARDREMAVHQVRTIREVLAQPEIAKYIKAERLPGAQIRTDEEIMTYVRQYAMGDYHPVGTCRMGTGDDAVVTPDLKVHGLDGLRVIDSSIMPRLVSGNTMAPTMMIAEKGADLVKASS